MKSSLKRHALDGYMGRSRLRLQLKVVVILVVLVWGGIEQVRRGVAARLKHFDGLKHAALHPLELPTNE